jgi:gluconokinase
VELSHRTEPLHGLKDSFARRWPALAGAAWFPALGDGACNNVGSGCFTARRIAVMIGTSGAMRVVWSADSVRVPPGLWLYRVDRHRPVLGGALSNGGNLYAWMHDTLRLDDSAGTNQQAAVPAPQGGIPSSAGAQAGEPPEERAIAAMAPDAHGLTVLPFLAGERSTGWAPHARAALVGLTLHTTPMDILRAGLEAVALRFAGIYALLLPALPAVPSDVGSRTAGAGEETQVIASGGALRSPEWMHIMADALGCRVIASGEAEATSRGAALLALEALGVLPDLSAAAVSLETAYDPVEAHHDIYRAARERQERLYRLLIAGGTEW